MRKGRNLSIHAANFSLSALQWSAKYGGRTLWIVGTTAVVVVLPLILELEREKIVIEMEKLQVKDLLEQGYPISAIQQSGLTLPHEPPVLTTQSSRR